MESNITLKRSSLAGFLITFISVLIGIGIWIGSMQVQMQSNEKKIQQVDTTLVSIEKSLNALNIQVSGVSVKTDMTLDALRKLEDRSYVVSK